MPFNWKAYVELARHLQAAAATAPDPEAWRRSALSRAYFGGYCYARNYAVDYLWFNARQRQDDHGALRAHLRTKKRRADADRLDELRQWRNQADYEDDLSLPEGLPTTVAKAIDRAEKIFASLTPPRSS